MSSRKQPVPPTAPKLGDSKAKSYRAKARSLWKSKKLRFGILCASALLLTGALCVQKWAKIEIQKELNQLGLKQEQALELVPRLERLPRRELERERELAQELAIARAELALKQARAEWERELALKRELERELTRERELERELVRELALLQILGQSKFKDLNALAGQIRILVWILGFGLAFVLILNVVTAVDPKVLSEAIFNQLPEEVRAELSTLRSRLEQRGISQRQIRQTMAIEILYVYFGIILVQIQNPFLPSNNNKIDGD